jgi:hypothetical protein
VTRRERLERRLERRREWAQGRRDKAAREFSRGEPYRGDVAFNTQPGHIPERARVIAAEDRGVAHVNMAQHHEARADGLERQLERTIFSDDADAAEQLEAKARSLEAQRDQMKRVNAAFRKAGSPKPDDADGWRRVAELVGQPDNDLREVRLDMARCHWERQPFPAYRLTNTGAEIRRCRARIEDVKRRAAITAEAEAAPSGLLIKRLDGHDWAVVTFAEKPDRAVLDALREAGYRWGKGSWQGKASALPPCVAQMEGGR